jgi:hypothetical protein
MADSLDQACSARASVWSTSGPASLRSAGLRRILPCSAITLPNFTALASIAVAPPTAVLHATEAIGPAMVAGRCVVEEAAAVPRRPVVGPGNRADQDPWLGAERLGDYRSAPRASGQTPWSSSSPLIALTSQVSVGSLVLVWTLT